MQSPFASFEYPAKRRAVMGKSDDLKKQIDPAYFPVLGKR